MAKKSSDGRTRNWTFIVYPESAPENWREILDETHSPYAVSPLHDKDINADGTPKKPHWHVCFLFEGVKSYEQIAGITASINATIPQRVESARGMLRYMAHMDNPEKAQYDPAQIEQHGGIEIAALMGTEQDAEMDLVSAMLDYIEENDITNLVDLVSYARYNEREWFRMLMYKSTYFVGQYIKERRVRKMQNE